ncbi:hypothetical protein BGZ70_006295, partial [Mortierella alpina]
LQRHIEAHQDKTAPRDDIVLMLSQDCLQYIKTRFLSPRAGSSGQGSSTGGGSGQGSSTGGGSGQGQASSDDGESISSFDSQASTDLNHPCWLNVVSNLRTPATHGITRYSEGLSQTSTEQLAQYATAVQNLWEGSILNKLMDYVFRVLLRLFLAPNRERKIKERAAAAAKKKQATIDAKRAATSATMTGGHWNRRKLLLCNELADLYAKPTTAAV